MYRKLMMGVCVAALSLAVCFSPQLARATSLSYNNGAVQAINDIIFEGIPYTITFVAPPADPLTNLSSLSPPPGLIQRDYDNIYAALNGSTGNGWIYETPSGQSNDFFYVFIDIPTGDTTSANVFSISNVNLDGTSTWHGQSYYEFDFPPLNDFYYSYPFAKFTPYTSPVPEPPTAVLILLGLGLISLAGLLRKSKRQIHVA